MDQRRQKLHELLETIVKNVYFEPPENKLLEYPCIVYHRKTGDTRFANNKPYNFHVCYNMVLMDTDPDSEYLAGFFTRMRIHESLYNRWCLS